MRAGRYDPTLVKPMREELTSIGFDELLTPESVDSRLAADQGTVLVVVNSVCGCAAGSARPGVREALKHDTRPDNLVTVFAGMEIDAVERARSYFRGYQPSSPQIALLRNGSVEHMLERKDIESRYPAAIADDLKAAFDKYCSPAT